MITRLLCGYSRVCERHPPHCTIHMSNQLTSRAGIKAKVENKGQYDEYLAELQPIRDELGVNLKESMYPGEDS